MVTRFALYSFLRTQQYFEPFLLLFLIDRGHSFTEIGLLVGFREVCVNLLEIPSGAMADLYGRRRCMVLSFSAYIVSFFLFAFFPGLPALLAAMALFAVGEAFRTGTHKAMIFTWLKNQGRLAEKKAVYGYTRSWGKIGAALSIVVATGLVLTTADYQVVFVASTVPYALGILLFLSYPADLDCRSECLSVRAVLAHLGSAVARSVRDPRLRRLMAESMSFSGVFKAVKDYVQPLIKTGALALPVLLFSDETRRAALLVGAVYVVMNLGAALASRRAHALAEWSGGEEEGAGLLWWCSLAGYGALAPLLFFQLHGLAIAVFVAVSLLENFWRPLQVSRFECFAAGSEGATVLSIESQSKTLATLVLAPLLGVAIDVVAAHGPGGMLWPVGAVGAMGAAAMLVLRHWPSSAKMDARCAAAPGGSQKQQHLDHAHGKADDAP